MGEIRFLGTKSFLISVFIHVAALGLFVFTLTPRPASPKPSVVFLGGILSNHDLEISDFPRRDDDSREILQTTKSIKLAGPMNPTQSLKSEQKPNTSAISFKGSKKVVKPSLAESPVENEADSSSDGWQAPEAPKPPQKLEIKTP